MTSFVITLLLFFLCDYRYHHRAVSFSTDKIYSPYCHTMPTKGTFPVNFEQPSFRELNNGRQAYVFESADGEYVIKFLKHHRYRPSTWLAFLPLNTPWKRELKNKQAELQKIYDSAELAFEKLQEQTEVVYIHWSAKSENLPDASLINRKGVLSQISLNEVPFLIQKKGEMIYGSITKLMEQDKADEAKGIISSVIFLLKKLATQGVVDNDPIIRRNFGLIGTRAIQIDVGTMAIDLNQSIAQLDAIPQVTTSFRKWLSLHHPTLLSHFDSEILNLKSP